MRRIAYGAAVFVSSACGLIVEIVAGRLLAPYVGMSLYTWTAIVAVVLAGLSAGRWIGGRLAGPGVDAARGARRVAAALALAAASSLASLVLLRLLAGLLLPSGLGPLPVIVLLAAALFLLPSLFVGIVAPILTKLAVDAEAAHPGRVIGRMYALGTLGSIAGTLAAGYVFISWIGSTGTVVAVAAAYAVLALAFAAADPLRLLLVVFLAVGGAALKWWGDGVRAFGSPCTAESAYFCIRIEDISGHSGRPGAKMVLDHLVHSISDRDNPAVLYSPYIQLVDAMAALRSTAVGARRAFFIGGGGYTLPRAWAAADPNADLLVAEVDPAVTAAAREHMWLDADAPGLTIVHGDARAVLQGLPRVQSFDVVFGDAFRDISIPAHLVTAGVSPRGGGAPSGRRLLCGQRHRRRQRAAIPDEPGENAETRLCGGRGVAGKRRLRRLRPHRLHGPHRRRGDAGGHPGGEPLAGADVEPLGRRPTWSGAWRVPTSPSSPTTSPPSTG